MLGFNSLKFGYISKVLAQILYSVNSRFDYRVDDSNNVYIDNKGSSSASNDLLMYSGRGIELTGTQSVDIPIHNNGGTGSFLTYQDLDTKEIVTLGNSVDGGSSKELIDFTTQTSFDSTGWTNIDNVNKTISWDGSVPDSSDSGRIGFNLTEEYVGKYVLISYTISNYSGSNNCGIDQSGNILDSEGGDMLDTRVSSNGTFVFLGYVTGTDVNKTILGRSSNAFTISNISIKEVLPESTTYTFSNKTVNNILTHTTNWSESDRIKIENNPNLIGKLALSETGSIDELDMELAEGDGWYACSEKTLSTLYDARGGDSATIANYIETIRTNSDFQNTGLQTTAFIKDTLNVPISYDDTALNFDGGSYGDSQLNPSIQEKFWFEEIVDNIIYQHNYDGTNLITYTNNVAGTPTAHTPEDASYLFGKGEYPKVDADGYTETVHKNICFYTGSQYDKYNQGSRYTKLQGLV